jgi:glyceraldehyde 3-phosphate dehydrogenase
MTLKVAINGSAASGRNILRAPLRRRKEARSAVRRAQRPRRRADQCAPAARTIRRTAVPGTIGVEDGALVVNGDRIKVLAERDPAKLPWKVARHRRRARMHGPLHAQGESRRACPLRRREEGHHLGAGEKDVDRTVVFGVNHQTLKAPTR